jgi:O-antigen/teichoic acid export membrane protein
MAVDEAAAGPLGREQTWLGRFGGFVGGVGPLVAAQAVNAAGNFVSLTLVARRLGPAGYGEYAVFLATALVVAQVSDAGLGRAITLVASRLAPLGDRQQVREAYATGWLVRASIHAAAMAAFALVTAAALAAHRPLLAFFASGSLAGLGVSLALFAGGVLQAERRFRSLALLNALPGALRTAFVASLTAAGALDLGTAAAAYALAPVVAVALVLPRLSGHRPRLARPRQPQLVQLWSAGKWIAVAAVLEVVYQRVDVIGLRLLSTPAETGIYAGAFIFVSAINFLVLAVNALAYPALATAAARRDLAELRQVFAASTAALAQVGIPLVCAVATVFPDVAGGFLGGAYARSALPMRFLAVYGVATVVQFNCGSLFLALGRSTRMVLWALLLALLEAVGVALLVPRYGAAGAAAAVAAAMVVMLPVSWTWAVRLVGFALPLRALAATALLAAAALAALALLPPLGPGPDLVVKSATWAAVAVAAVALGARQTQPLLVAARGRSAASALSPTAPR